MKAVLRLAIIFIVAVLGNIIMFVSLFNSSGWGLILGLVMYLVAGMQVSYNCYF